MIRLWVVLALIVAGIPADAAPPPSAAKPLLFSPEETASLEKAVADYERLETTGQKSEEAAAPPSATPNIFVTAIADYGEGQWTVWANGYKISPGRQPPDFSVLGVKTDQAEIMVPGEQPVRFTLHSYQTWRARSKDIVEGIFP